MKIQISQLVVLTSQPMGCMFPTQDLFTFATRFIMIEVLEHLITTVDPGRKMLQPSIQRDTRRRFKPTLLHGDEINCYESEEDGKYYIIYN